MSPLLHILSRVHSALLPLAQSGAPEANWMLWPFGGYGEGLLTSIARLAFAVAILGGVAWLLRKLFGPGGRLRPAEFGTGHIEVRRRNKQRIKELQARCKRGEMGMDEFLKERDRLLGE
jgi:hypothetical protein